MNFIKNENPRIRLDTPANNYRTDPEKVKDAVSTIHHRWILSGEKTKPLPLFQTASKLLNENSKGNGSDHITWNERAEFGGLYLNGRKVLSDREITEESLLEYYEPKYDLRNATEEFPVITKENILYEDLYLAVVYKPAGLSTTPSREQHHFSLKHSLEKLYGHTIHLPSRLDTATAGLVTVSLHRDMHGPLQHLYENRLVEKQYHCEIPWREECELLLESGVLIDAPIGRSPTHPVLRTIDRDEGDSAQTKIDLLEKRAHSALLSARPITGRTHQIRLHLAAFFSPIFGDPFYGGESSPDGLRLCSVAVRFSHPISKEEIDVTLPKHFLPPWRHDIEV